MAAKKKPASAPKKPAAPKPKAKPKPRTWADFRAVCGARRSIRQRGSLCMIKAGLCKVTDETECPLWAAATWSQR